MKKKDLKLLKLCIVQSLICFVVFLILHFIGIFEIFENKTYDQRMRATANNAPSCDEIAFIAVNQESLDWALENKGWSWPWPREAYAQIIDFLSAGNVKSIAFDMLYTEPSIYGKADDEALGVSEKESEKVIQTIFVTEIDGKEDALFPVLPIKEGAKLLGNVTSVKDSDDYIRRARVSYQWNGVEYPSLGFAPLFLNEDEPDFSSLPILKDKSLLLRYRESINSYFPYQACDILQSYDAWKNQEEGLFIPEDFEDLYVYFALYAPGLFDICSTPVSQVYPGVGVHITALDNYLTNSFIKKCNIVLETFWYLMASLFGALIICFSFKIKSQKVQIVCVSMGTVLGVSLLIGLPCLLFNKNIYLILIGPTITFLFSFLTSLILGFFQENKQKRFIKSAFSQCLAKDVVNQILEDPDSFTLGGKKFNMSAIFTDIQKFSSFSELLSASELGSLLNYYLTKMSDIIIEEKGTVDKYEGDAIVALVGAPVEMKDHGIRACTAAVKMKKEEIKMNNEIIQIASLEEKPGNIEENLFSAFKILVKNNKIIFTRIGINSGEMIAGYFGSQNKKNYTMMGNNVNLAARLEGVNKQYHTNGILISEATKNELNDEFIIRSLDKVRVVNVEKPIQLYEVLDFKSEQTSQLFEYTKKWEKAMSLFSQEQYKECLLLFKELNKQNNDDEVVKYYIELLEKFFIKGKYPVSKDNFGVEYIPESRVFKLLQK